MPLLLYQYSCLCWILTNRQGVPIWFQYFYHGSTELLYCRERIILFIHYQYNIITQMIGQSVMLKIAPVVSILKPLSCKQKLDQVINRIPYTIIRTQ